MRPYQPPWRHGVQRGRRARQAVQGAQARQWPPPWGVVAEAGEEPLRDEDDVAWRGGSGIMGRVLKNRDESEVIFSCCE